MSYLFVSALMRHKTPEEFVEKFLAPGIKRGSLKPFPGRQLPELYFKGPRLFGIMFYNNSNPSQVCPVHLHRTVLSPDRMHNHRNPDPAQTPTINVFGKPGVALNKSDWERLARPKRIFETLHSGWNASSSQVLLLPASAVAHWNPRFVSKRGNKFAKVGLQKETFNKLVRYASVSEVLSDYLSTILFLSGEIKEPRYRQILHFDRRGVTNQRSLAAFAALYSSHIALFAKFGQLRNYGDVKKALEEHFGFTGGKISNFARKIVKVFSTPRRLQAAERLAEDLEKNQPPNA